MNLQFKIIIVAALGLLLFLYFQNKNESQHSIDQNQQTNISTTHQQNTSKTVSTSAKYISAQNSAPENKNKSKDTENIQLAEGVSEKFHDKPEIQVAWMNRGKDILIKNIPGIDSANFRKTYFHRAFNGRPMTCGEVELIKNNKVISDYQRFIYVGVHSAHLENNIPNFDILWDKMCIQTLEDENP